NVTGVQTCALPILGHLHDSHSLYFFQNGFSVSFQCADTYLLHLQNCHTCIPPLLTVFSSQQFLYYTIYCCLFQLTGLFSQPSGFFSSFFLCCLHFFCSGAFSLF